MVCSSPVDPRVYCQEYDKDPSPPHFSLELETSSEVTTRDDHPRVDMHHCAASAFEALPVERDVHLRQHYSGLSILPSEPMTCSIEYTVAVRYPGNPRLSRDQVRGQFDDNADCDDGNCGVSGTLNGKPDASLSLWGSRMLLVVSANAIQGFVVP